MSIFLCRQSLQQDTIALDRLADMQAALNFPDARCNRFDDRNAEVLFKRCDHAQRIPRRSQDVDGIRARVVEKRPLDEGVHGFRRNILDGTE